MTKTIMFMNTRGQDVWFLMWQFCLLTWLGKICVPVVRIVCAQVNFHLLHCYCFVLFVVCSVIFSCYSFCSTCFCTLCTTHRLTFKSCCCYCSVLSFLIFFIFIIYIENESPRQKKLHWPRYQVFAIFWLCFHQFALSQSLKLLVSPFLVWSLECLGCPHQCCKRTCKEEFNELTESQELIENWIL